MPWLEENRNSDRFGDLLFAIGPVAGYSAADFFRAFSPLLKTARSPVSAKFREEVESLSQDCPAYESSLSGLFLNLTATGYREQFYNALVGFALEGYAGRTEQFLKAECGEEVLTYYQTRLLDNLYNLIHIPALPVDADPREAVLIFRVKAALNILYYRFLQRRKHLYKGIHWAYHPEKGLQVLLAAHGLGERESNELMDVLKKGMKSDENAPGPPPDIEPPAVPKSTAPDARMPETHDLKELALQWSADVQQVKQGLAALVTGEHAPAPQQETAQMLDSATVCKMLHISKSTLQRYRNRQLLSFTQIGGKYLYTAAAVQQLIQQGGAKKEGLPGNNRHQNT